MATKPNGTKVKRKGATVASKQARKLVEDAPAALRRRLNEAASARSPLQSGVVALCEKTVREIIEKAKLQRMAERARRSDERRGSLGSLPRFAAGCESFPGCGCAESCTVREIEADLVDADGFIQGLHSMREARIAAKGQRRLSVRAARAVHAIKAALEEAPTILADADQIGMREVSHLGELRRLLGQFEKLPYPGSKPLPWEISDDDQWTRRQYVLQEFDSEDFLGLGREATVGELAAISLLLDPAHGCGDPRRSDAKKAWAILKQERDAIARDRKADLKAAIKLCEKPYEPPADPGPHVKHRAPGKYVATSGGRLVRIGDPSNAAESH